MATALEQLLIFLIVPALVLTATVMYTTHLREKWELQTEIKVNALRFNLTGEMEQLRFKLNGELEQLRSKQLREMDELRVQSTTKLHTSERELTEKITDVRTQHTSRLHNSVRCFRLVRTLVHILFKTVDELRELSSQSNLKQFVSIFSGSAKAGGAKMLDDLDPYFYAECNKDMDTILSELKQAGGSLPLFKELESGGNAARIGFAQENSKESDEGDSEEKSEENVTSEEEEEKSEDKSEEKSEEDSNIKDDVNGAA